MFWKQLVSPQAAKKKEKPCKINTLRINTVDGRHPAPVDMAKLVNIIFFA